MRGGTIAAGIGIVAMAVAPAASAAPDPVRSAIQSMLEKSAAGWNAADLDLFMSCYENAPSTSYVSGNNVMQGFDAIRASYAKRFAGGAKAMGRLSLDLLDLRPVGKDHVYVIGRFTLHRPAADGGDVSGITTLLFKKTQAGWRIVADHS